MKCLRIGCCRIYKACPSESGTEVGAPIFPAVELCDFSCRLCVDSMCYTDIVYVQLFNLKYICAFKLNKTLHKFISPTFTFARLIFGPKRDEVTGG